jgi:membrane-associated phospholipid phosphatase
MHRELRGAGRQETMSAMTTAKQPDDRDLDDEAGDATERVVDRALAETPEQQYVGSRDLTRWPSGAGRLLLRFAQRAGRWVAPHEALAITLAIGLVLVGLLTALAEGVYDAVTESDGVAGLDRPVLTAVMSIRTPWANHLIGAYTNLGGTVGMPILATTAAVVMALWWRQWSPIVLIAITAAGSLALTTIGKAAVGRIRPPLADAVPPFEHSFSFPSGHSLNSMAIAGMVAYLLIRREEQRWARITTLALATAFAVTMGLSRVYLAAHWLTDVLVAWALALAWLTVVITAHRLFLTARRGRRAAAPASGPAERSAE